jgi:hypothetical protein
MPFQHLEEGFIRMAVGLFEDRFEIPGRLMVVNGENEVDVGHDVLNWEAAAVL